MMKDGKIFIILLIMIFSLFSFTVKAEPIFMYYDNLSNASYLNSLSNFKINSYTDILLQENNISQVKHKFDFLNSNGSLIFIQANQINITTTGSYPLYCNASDITGNLNCTIDNDTITIYPRIYQIYPFLSFQGIIIPPWSANFIEEDFSVDNHINVSGLTRIYNHSISEFYPINFYQEVIEIPNKAYLGSYLPIWSLHINDMNPSPDNIYNINGNTELVYNSNKNEFKESYVQPLRIIYSYEIIPSTLIIIASLILFTAIFYIVVDRTFSFIEEKYLKSYLGSKGTLKNKWRKAIFYVIVAVVSAILVILFTLSTL